MNAHYEDMIIQKLLLYSEEKTDIEKAKKEWVYHGEVIDYGPIKDQVKKMCCMLCDHPIRYGYVIENKGSKRKITVGSECIGNYTMVHMGIVESSFKSYKRTQYNNAIKAFYGAQWTISNLKMYIRRLIDDNPISQSWNNPSNKGYVIDYEALNTNNEVVLYKEIKSGIVHEISKKYDLNLREDYIQDFCTIYENANKTKQGFFRSG